MTPAATRSGGPLLPAQVLAPISLAGVVAGAAQVASNPPDYAGMALLVTAITGLIVAVAGIVRSFRRGPSSSDELLRLLIEQNKPKDPP